MIRFYQSNRQCEEMEKKENKETFYNFPRYTNEHSITIIIPNFNPMNSLIYNFFEYLNGKLSVYDYSCSSSS